MSLRCPNAIAQGYGRAFPKSPGEAVILSEAKNPIPRAETLRCAQGENRKTLEYGLGQSRFSRISFAGARHSHLCGNDGTE